MTTPDLTDISLSGQRWARLRAWAGYALFAGILAWAMADAPQVLWQADPLWLAAVVPFTLLNLFFQVIQTRIFLHDRGVETPGWRIPAHFTLKKAVLNIVMPIRTGTLLLLGMLTNHYPVRSMDFVGYMVVASLYSLLISLLGAVWLFLPGVWFASSLILLLLFLTLARHSPKIPFSGCTLSLFLNSLGMFVTYTAGLWFLFLGFGHALPPRETVVMAVILNVLALVNVTPGNMGIREMVMGAIAPMLAVPITVGILAGAAFFSIRLAMVGLLLGGMEAGILISQKRNRPPTPLLARPREKLVQWLALLRSTPLHPVWLGRGVKQAPVRILREQVGGLVLDVGAADSPWQDMLPAGARYIALDYYQTARNWYGSQPHVYGHAQQLPFASGRFDWILLLNVMEHIPNPGLCADEIYRVLKPEGRLLLQVPFLYPMHDVPLDFQRFTPYGLEVMARESGFHVESLETFGHPVETAGHFLNIALSRGFLDLLSQRHPLAILVVFLPPLVVLINLAAWLAGKVLPAHPMICQSLLTVWRKPLVSDESPESTL